MTVSGDAAGTVRPPNPDAPSADSPWPVALLAGKLKDYIDRLGAVWVEGEVTQWQVRNGSVYGKLKDLAQDATVGFTIWSSTAGRITDSIGQGDRVVALVKTNYWVKGGSLTMIVSQMRHRGLGDLLERLEQLRRQLADEGLFDPARKHRLPFLPQCIGLITGANSDAEKDVLRNAALRWPSVQFRTIHTAVQGDRVPEEVTAAIAELDADPTVDVIIIARGGGDFQHLLGFSDESVVRAAASATTPIVSAIGHENDHPLLDDVADLRASTPTDAAKRVVPDVAEELGRIQQARATMTSRLAALLRVESERILQLRTRPALGSSSWILDSRQDEIARSADRATELVARALERAEHTAAELSARLRTLSPQATLDRGYAIVRGETGVITEPRDAPDGTPLEVLVAGGRFGVTSTGPAVD